MTKDEATKILRLCQQHELPKPQVGNHYDGYFVKWSIKGDIKVKLRDYSAAYHFCRVLYLEQKARDF